MDEREVALDVLAEVSGLPRGEILPDKDLVADLGIDSPRALRLLIELEDRFSLEIPDEDAAQMSTVEDVLSYLKRTRGSGSGGPA